MYKELLIKSNADITMAALLEDKQLVNVNIERNSVQRLIGNIYKGEVENVLPGMQAAFVDIGMEKNSFLYVDDAMPKAFNEAGESIPVPKTSITEVLKKGQEILVQVFKEPVGTKGARVTTHPTLPGRYLVLMPTSQYIAVSRRIEDEKERTRLKKIMAELLPPGVGVIVRTVAYGAEKEVLAAELKYLLRLWKRILGRAAASKAPSLIHQDIDLLQRIIRDTGIDEVDAILIDMHEDREKILDVIEGIEPSFKDKVHIRQVDDIMTALDIPQQLNKALNRKVWLDSGGYIIIDQMEALTAIDVNTGKYVGDFTLSDTVLHTNLEAVAEIVRQLRLRNIGGIVIVDFIDMDFPEHRERLLQALEAEMKKDKTKSSVLGMTQLGLVEITRKKSGQELTHILEKDCPCCHGKGRVISEEIVALQIKRELQELALETEAPCLFVEAHSAAAAYLIGHMGNNLNNLEKKLNKKIIIRGNNTRAFNDYVVRASYEEFDENHSAPVYVGERLYIKIEELHSENFYDGIGRINGFVINVVDGGALVGETVEAEITEVNRTFAKAKLIER